MIETNLSFRVNGREVSADAVGDELEREFWAAAAEGIAEKVAPPSCPVHGQPKAVQVELIKEGDDLTFSFKACCEAFEPIVEEALERDDADDSEEFDVQ